MKKYLRSKRKDAPYKTADEFLQIELSQAGVPDEELSCNHIDQNDVTKCLIEYKATNLPKPRTGSISGFFLPNKLKYDLKKETKGFFDLVKNTHHCLHGSSYLPQVASIGFNHSDISLSKENVFAFIDDEEQKGNREWLDFLAQNPKWGNTLNNYRTQRKAAALKAWQRYGQNFKPGNIKRLLDLDPAKTKELLIEIIESKALPQPELNDLKKYI